MCRKTEIGIKIQCVNLKLTFNSKFTGFMFYEYKIGGISLKQPLLFNHSVLVLNSFTTFLLHPYICVNVVRCAIWYHLYNLKNVKNTHGEVLFLVKSNTPPWFFFTLFKL